MIKRVSLIPLLLLLASCASVPMADKMQDLRLKNFDSPGPDKAGIYVYRNETLGGAISMMVTLNGQTLGKTGPYTYLHTVVEPGTHTIGSSAENTSAVIIDAKPGINYFVWQEVTMGLMMAGSKLQRVSAAKGKAGVLECDLAKTNDIYAGAGS